MAAVTFNALRALYPGRTLGEQVSIDLPLLVLSPSQRTEKNRSVALSGKTQTVVSRRDFLYQCETLYRASDTDDYLRWYEFLESVDESEHFIFDELGTVAAPVAPRSALLESNYSRERKGPSNEFKFSFSLRLLP